MIFRLWMEDPLHTTAPARLTPLIVGVTALGSAPVVLLAVLVGAGLLMARHATRQLKALLGVSVLTQKRREAPAFMPGRDRRWARRAQCPRAQQDPRSARALNGRGHGRGGSPGIHAGEDVPGLCGS